MALGSVLFLALLLRPIVAQLGSAGQAIERTCIAIAAWSALALVLCETATVALQTAVLVGTVDLSLARRAAREFRRRRAGEGDRGGADRADPVRTRAARADDAAAGARRDRAGRGDADHACRRAARSPHAAAAGGVPAPVRRGDLDRRHSVLPGGAQPRAERAVMAADRRAVLAHVDGRRRLHRGERPDHEHRLYRRLGGLLRHRLWRDGRCQDRDVPDAARLSAAATSC